MKSNVIDGIWVITLGGLMYLYTFSIDITRWDGESISPRFIPSLLAITIIGLGILLIIRTWVQNNARKLEKENQEDIQPSNVKNTNYKTWLIILSSILYLILIGYIGFVITSVVYIFFLLRLFHSTSIMKNGLISIATALVLFCIFEYLFNIQLPKIIW